MGGPQDKRAEEARDNAARAGREGDFFSSPAAADEDDALDRLGTRIGRFLGLVISLALLAGVLVYALRGGA